MHRLVILASVAVMAASNVNCANSSDRANSASDLLLLAPSASNVVAAPIAAERHPGKPGNGSGSLVLVMYADVNANGLPNWGDTVEFNVSTTATTEPHVDLQCSQNGVVVYGATTGFYASYPWPWTQLMPLSSTAWQSGAANCTATLYYFSGTKKAVLSSIAFTADQ